MANRPPTVGGQAVLEGVMMRSPWRVATAVRDPEGVIRVKARPFVSLTRRVGLLKLPVLRGAVGLFEALRIGMGALSWSGEIAGEEEAGQRGWIDHAVSALVILLAFAAGIGLFMLTPYAVAGLVPRTGNQVVFHLVAGGLRILLLVGYMAAITLLRDIRRVLQYHGAEHKSIFAFESGLPLEPSSACPQSRFHPRCGTSFLLLAAVLTMIGFMALDTLIVSFAGPFRSALHRVLVHLPLLPLVAGAAYEVLRIAERYAEHPFGRPFVLPGFLLQRLTTREPDESQVEVALASLQEALRRDEGAYEGPAREPETAPDSGAAVAALDEISAPQRAAAPAAS